MTSIIIVTYNSADVIVECLRALGAVSLQGQGGMTEVIVVDNASTDGTADILKRVFPGVRTISRAGNAGFAAAVNQAASIARGEFLFLVNPDSMPANGCLDLLSRAMEELPHAGITVPRILNPDGSHQPSVWNFPTRSSLLRELALPYFVSSKLLDRTPRRGTAPVAIECASGAAMLIRRELFSALGGFDERFFMYYEDIDLCLRAAHRGDSTCFVPQAEVRHHQGKSSDGDPARRLSYLYRSLIAYWEKHSPGGSHRTLILRGLRWKELFYFACGILLFSPELRRLAKSYGESRAELEKAR